MDTQTIRHLNRYNQEFYSRYGRSFARQREYFWPSWYVFIESSRLIGEHEKIRVLDVGCGSGRFAMFWSEVVSAEFEYTGVDISDEMLAEAKRLKEGVSFPVELMQLDVVEAILGDTFVVPNNPHLITLFGVLHHIPDAELRKKLLQNLVDALPVGGELWFTIWNPKRVGARHPQTREVLAENGDEIVGWQGDSEAERYVHWISENEENNIISSLSHVKVLEKWNQNTQGERGNICVILQKV